MTSHLLKTLREVLMDAVHVSFDFFKVLIPISIAMKILAELDWIRYLALPLEPVMQLTGLPADLGIAWATGIMVNFYSALIVFIGRLPGLPPLTTEQVTTLAVMMLIAHSIPAEGRIAAQCGVSFIGQAVIRLVVAVIGGVIVHTSCQAFGWLDTPARIVFTPSPDVNLLWWALGEVRNLVSIFCVIFFVMLLQRFLRYLKVADLVGRALAPALRVLGMRPAAATAMIVGVITGIVYASGVILKEVRSGEMSRHDVFSCMTLMGLAHAIIEDTCLMLLIGAHIGGIFFLRLALAFVTCAVINILYLRFRGDAREPETAPNEVS